MQSEGREDVPSENEENSIFLKYCLVVRKLKKGHLKSPLFLPTLHT